MSLDLRTDIISMLLPLLLRVGRPIPPWGGGEAASWVGMPLDYFHRNDFQIQFGGFGPVSRPRGRL